MSMIIRKQFLQDVCPHSNCMTSFLLFKQREHFLRVDVLVDELDVVAVVLLAGLSGIATFVFVGVVVL